MAVGEKHLAVKRTCLATLHGWSPPRSDVDPSHLLRASRMVCPTDRGTTYCLRNDESCFRFADCPAWCRLACSRRTVPKLSIFPASRAFSAASSVMVSQLSNPYNIDEAANTRCLTHYHCIYLHTSRHCTAAAPSDLSCGRSCQHCQSPRADNSEEESCRACAAVVAHHPLCQHPLVSGILAVKNLPDGLGVPSEGPPMPILRTGSLHLAAPRPISWLKGVCLSGGKPSGCNMFVGGQGLCTASTAEPQSRLAAGSSMARCLHLSLEIGKSRC